MLQENADKMLLFKFSHLKNKRKGIFEFLFGMLFTVLTATFSCLLLSPRMNRSVCEIISKHYIVPRSGDPWSGDPRSGNPRSRDPILGPPESCIDFFKVCLIKYLKFVKTWIFFVLSAY